jgi:hypothetical protein
LPHLAKLWVQLLVELFQGLMRLPSGAQQPGNGLNLLG